MLLCGIRRLFSVFTTKNTAWEENPKPFFLLPKIAFVYVKHSPVRAQLVNSRQLSAVSASETSHTVVCRLSFVVSVKKR